MGGEFYNNITCTSAIFFCANLKMFGEPDA